MAPGKIILSGSFAGTVITLQLFELPSSAYNKTDEDTQKRGLSMEKSTAGTNKGSPDGLSHPNRNTIIINIIWYNFIRNGKRTMKFN